MNLSFYYNFKWIFYKIQNKFHFHLIIGFELLIRGTAKNSTGSSDFIVSVNPFVVSSIVVSCVSSNFKFDLSIEPNLSATLNRISAVQNSGIRTNNFPESDGKWNPNLCSNNTNGSYVNIVDCSIFHGTIGTDWFLSEKNSKILK